MYNESGADLLFGEQMALEYQKDGTWVEALTRLSHRASERSYTAMGRECPNGGSTQGTFSLNEYPALRAGRIVWSSRWTVDKHCSVNRL